MLFDLTSPKRKNVVRVVYGALAVLFAGGFILFGIGSESGAGGLFDGIFGEGGSGSTAEQFEQQVEDAEERLEANPEDQRALQELAFYRAQSGIAQMEVDETGQPTGVTEEARGELEAAVDAWSRYVATEPRKVDFATGSQIRTAYQFLGDAEGAADVQEALIEAEGPDFVGLAQLAQLRYFDLDLKRGDAALDRARAEADEGNQAQIKQLEDLREQVVKAKKRQAKQPDSEEGAESALESPFGGVDPNSGLPPITP